MAQRDAKLPQSLDRVSHGPPGWVRPRNLLRPADLCVYKRIDPLTGSDSLWWTAPVACRQNDSRCPKKRLVEANRAEVKIFQIYCKKWCELPANYGDQWLSAGTLLLLFVRHVLLSSEDSVSRDSEYIRRDCAAQPRTAGAQVITRLFAIANM